MTRRLALFCAAALAIATALAPFPALPSLTAPTQVQCGNGEFVVGLTGRTGSWIDAVGPICAGWNDRNSQTIPGRPRRPVGGPGRGSNAQFCPAGSAMSALWVGWILQNDAAFADVVAFTCHMLAPPHNPTSVAVRFAGQNNLRRGMGRPTVIKCPEGQLATSISVWTSSDGRFVTDVSMRCGPAPNR